MSEIRVVIPSLQGDIEILTSICDAATRAGARPLVIANGAQLCSKLSATLVPHVTSRRNDGFAASVALGAEGNWDWLVILNDDLVFDPRDLESQLSAKQLDKYSLHAIIHFDNEPSRLIPSRLGVLLSVSMLSNIHRRLVSRWRAPLPENAHTYRSFSSVAIGRHAWDSVGGIDTRYPFTYEDADFVRRLRARGVQIIGVPTSVVHLHSRTSNKWVTTVLPVSTWSALEYLSKWYGNRSLHRWLLIIALFVRGPIAAGTSRRPFKQLQAVSNSIAALFHNRRPSLPDWERV